MVIARAYRHTEKLLQDNKEKLALVCSAYLKHVLLFIYFFFYSGMTRGAVFFLFCF